MEISEISIRDAAENDLPAIHEIEVRSFASPWSMQSLRNELSISFSHVIVAVIDGEVVGYAVAWDVRGDINLNHLAVASSMRERGIGRMLVQRIVERLGSRGAQRIYLEVGARNSVARSFYLRLGFQESGLRKDYYPDDDAVLMEREIGE